MKRRKSIIWILTAFLVLCSVRPVNSISEVNALENDGRRFSLPDDLSDRDYVEGEILVGFLRNKESEVLDSADATSLLQGSDVEIAVVDTEGKSVEETIEEYLAMPDVVFAEPNYIVQPAMDSPDYTPDQYYPTGNTGGIDVPDWNTTSSSDDVVVAIIDSGVDYEHEDLKDVMWNDGLNYPELVEMGGGAHGFNAAAYVDGGVSGSTDSPVPSPADGGYHGTHVAGIVAASWNNKGVSGITNDVKLMAIRTATEEGAVEMDNVVAGYNYMCKAYDAGVNIVVANNSWGGNYMSYATLYAVREATKRGMIMVFATGNENTNMDVNNSFAYMISDLQNVIMVNASDNKEGIAHFSNYGQYSTDVYAPGTEIISTMPHNLLYANPNFSTPILENDFEVESDLVVEGFDSEGNPISSARGDGGGYKGSDGYIPADDYGSYLDISCNNDLSTAAPKYLTFMVEKDRIYNKDMFWLMVNTTDGETKTVTDGGVVEAGKWAVVSLELPEDTDYASFKCKLIAEMVFLKHEDETDCTIRYDNMMLTNDAWPYYKLSGTSMAAPVVTGEVAAIANANPDDSPRMLVARTLGSVKKKDELSDRCITGGIVNLRNALDGKFSPVIFDATIEGSEVTVDGEFFSNSGDLYINDAPVNVTEWSDDHIVATIDNLDRSKRMIKVEVRNNNIEGFNRGSRYIAREEVKTDFTEIPIPEELEKLSYPNYFNVSLGDCIYFMTAPAEQNEIYITEYNTKTGEWKDVTKDESYGFVTGQIVAYKGTILTIAGKKSGDKYDPQIFQYDPDTGEIKWTPIDGIDFYKASTLVNYKGDLLILGGGQINDFNDYRPNNEIIRVDLDAKKLTSVGNTESLYGVPENCIPYYDTLGNVYLGYARNIYEFIRIDKKSDDLYEATRVSEKCTPNDYSDSESTPAYSMAYAEEGVLVTGSDVFDGYKEVLSDTYLGTIASDGDVSFSNYGKLYNSTVALRPMSVVNGENYYVLASLRGSKNLGKTLRYIGGFTELIPEGSTKDREIIYTNVEGAGSVWTKGSLADLKFVYKRSFDDETTFSHFKGISVDDKAVDPSNFTAESGSVIIKLKSSFLETLAVGDHTLTVSFDDGADVKTTFTIKDNETPDKDNSEPEKENNTSEPKKESSPQSSTPAAKQMNTPHTGDDASPAMILWIMLISGCGIIAVMLLRRKSKAL